MGFRHFRANVVARLAVFAALVFTGVWGYVEAGWQLTPFVCGFLALLALVELLRYVESVNRELAGFLDFVSHHDFSAHFPIREKGQVFHDLESAYELLMRHYRSLNEAREVNHRYLEALVEHVSVALLCLDDKGNVTLMNAQAKRLFEVPHLHTLRSLRRIDPALPEEIEALGDGDRRLVRLQIDGESMQLVLFVTEFRLLDRDYKLISFQNIRDELEQREIDFSQKLIRVLTHEIMNSVTPIIALSKVVEESLLETAEREDLAGPGGSDRDDLLRSLASIQSRGDGLLRFVQAYGSLTSLPQPKRSEVEVAKILRETVTLVAPTLKASGVTLATRVPGDGLRINVDPEQIQQVLLNLVRNAVEALDGRGNGRIVLSAGRDRDDRPVIQVTDNGPGIAPEKLEEIFVPFYTTKRNGTGVGLSVSRQIMFMNKGLVSVRTAPGQGSEFTLQFRA